MLWISECERWITASEVTIGGIQEWLSFYFKSSVAGEDLIHLGLDYYE
jgi:hypothetical protein